MIKPTIPSNEAERLQALWQLKLLNTEPEERFDRITKRAIENMHVAIATITLLDKDREWFKSCQGIDVREQPRDISFCAHTLDTNHLLVVEDTLKDVRFADNPQVLGPLHVRFYAGVPLHDRKSGYTIGVFCVKDTKPRKLSKGEFALLFELALDAEAELMKSAS